MKIFLTLKDDTLLRISDGDGAFLTIRIHKPSAQILSIVVPWHNRNKGIGKSLVFAAQRILLQMGVKELDAYFTDEIMHLKELFLSTGFEEISQTDIVAAPMGMVLYSPNVKFAIAKSASNTGFVPMRKFSIDQLNSTVSFLNESGADITNYDFAHYNSFCSGTVFGRDLSANAVILCSQADRDIHVDLALSRNSDDPSHVLSVMLGMIDGVIRQGAESSFDRLTLVTYNQKVLALIRKVLPDNLELDTIGESLFMKRTLVKKDIADLEFEFEQDNEELLESYWEREVYSVPVQKNITWKGPWTALRGGK